VGYVFRLEDADRLDRWFEREPGRTVLALETELLQRVWSPSRPQRVLEGGCGTGRFLRWFAEQGHLVTGIEPSWELVQRTRRAVPQSITVDRGFAEDLPYEDGEFDTVALITTLEFVNHPKQALSEAFRVARRHVLVGFLNKYSFAGIARRLEGFWRPTVYRQATFFSVGELRRLAGDLLCGAPAGIWRSCLTLPLALAHYAHPLERCRFFQVHPFGHFVAMRLDIRYTCKTIQDPLLAPLPRGAAPVRLHPSCRCFPASERNQPVKPRPPAATLESSSAVGSHHLEPV